jgi:hypothetical protein
MSSSGSIVARTRSLAAAQSWPSCGAEPGTSPLTAADRSTSTVSGRPEARGLGSVDPARVVYGDQRRDTGEREVTVPPG